MLMFIYTDLYTLFSVFFMLFHTYLYTCLFYICATFSFRLISGFHFFNVTYHIMFLLFPIFYYYFQFYFYFLLLFGWFYIFFVKNIKKKRNAEKRSKNKKCIKCMFHSPLKYSWNLFYNVKSIL